MNANKLRPSPGRDDDNEADDRLSQVLTSKPGLVSGAAFFGAGALSLAGPDQGALLAALKPYAPAVMSLAGSFFAGLVIGRIARRRLKPVLVAGAVVAAAVALLTWFGIIGPAADQWVQSSVGWVSDGIGQAQAWLAALLPSATAAGSGIYLGFRRKRKPR